MPGTPVPIGPFTGGLNTFSDTTAVADNEATELLNFDIDIDGSLVTRPPITLEATTPGPDLPLRLLGYFVTSNGEQYLIASVARGLTAGTYAYSATGWTLLTSTIPAAAFVQYMNKAWLIAPPGYSNPGGSWDPVNGFVAITAMKKGTTAVIYKERMWIGEGGQASTSSRLYFSNPGNFAVWNASDFVDIKNGDGQDIIDAVVYADTIVICKQNSMYIFSYDTKPTAGQVRQISNTIGVAARDCIVEHENNLYLFHGKYIYTMVNWNFERINLKVPLTVVNSKPNNLTSPYIMSRVNDRLILRYYDTYYVYNLRARVWAIWTTPRALGRFFQVPVDTTNPEPDKFLATSAWTDFEALYSFVEGFSTDRIENFYYSVVSKTYDFDSPFTFKRLFWWGGDVISKASWTATVYPVSYGRNITWDEARLITWAQARQYTWARPADIAISVDSDRSVGGSDNRTFVKFHKSLRFRQINFQISGMSNGQSINAPMRIFNFTAFILAKQKVTQTIN
jgi:hypothetical protein